MQRIYAVQTLSQLELYADDIRAGLAVIQADADAHGARVRHEAWDEIIAHVAVPQYARLFLVIEDGVLVGWLAAKVYVDGPRRNGCITWAWAKSGCRVSPDVIREAEKFFRAFGCQASYLGRSYLQSSFSRLMKRYGYTMQSIVYEKRLDEAEESDHGRVGHSAASGSATAAEHPPGHEPVRQSVCDADSGADADLRSADAGDDRADGEPAEHGDQHADAASGVGLSADDAGTAASGGGLDSAAPGATSEWSHGRGLCGLGKLPDSSEPELDAGTGSGGTADERAARAS